MDDAVRRMRKATGREARELEQCKREHALGCSKRARGEAMSKPLVNKKPKRKVSEAVRLIRLANAVQTKDLASKQERVRNDAVQGNKHRVCEHKVNTFKELTR
jgi:hypothetical protein